MKYDYQRIREEIAEQLSIIDPDAAMWYRGADRATRLYYAAKVVERVEDEKQDYSQAVADTAEIARANFRS